MAHDQNKSAIKGLKRKNIIRKLLNSKKKKFELLTQKGSADATVTQ